MGNILYSHLVRLESDVVDARMKRTRIEPALLITNSIRQYCTCMHGVDAENSTSLSINHGPPFAMENPINMDSSLWSCLHEELIEKVLSRLPAASMLQFGTVCKKWSKIRATKCFLEACSQVTSCEPYFVKISGHEHDRLLLCFDPSIHRWRKLEVSYLPSEVGSPVASSCGLICFINSPQAYLRDGLVLFVTNPVTKTWKELPRCLCWQRPLVVSMIMWKRPSHYKVIVMGVESSEMFDSMEGKWSTTQNLPHDSEEVGSHNLAVCNGSLYCLPQHSRNNALLVFNIQDEVWSKVTTGRLPGHSKFRNLLMCKGHIVIVGKSVRDKKPSVCVWLLEWKTMKWREVGRTPQCMLYNFLYCTSKKFHCCSHGDLIFLMSDMWKHVGHKCLLFDLAENMWRWVVNWAYILEGCSSVIALEPRLDSQV